MKKDIFDKLMGVSFLKWANPFYVKYKKVLLYLFFGFIIFCINIVFFAGFNKALGINELVSNVFTWIIAASLAYITNKIWVFESTNIGIIPIIKEALTFFAGRIGTLIVYAVYWNRPYRTGGFSISSTPGNASASPVPPSQMGD